VTSEIGALDEPKPALGPLSRNWAITILTATAAALCFKLVLALKTYGTNDVYRYEEFLASYRFLGVQVYRATFDLNHPPSMLHVLTLVGWLTNITGLPFPFWLRVPGIFADVGSVWVLSKILGERLREQSMRWALLMFAVAPPMIMMSGFHGNTDTIMVFFLLLSVYLTEQGQHIAAAGAAFGLSMCFKVPPIITVPLMFFYLPDLKKRVTFFASAAAALIIAWSPYIFEDPRFILGQIFGYRSYYGHWGLSYLVVLLVQRMPELGWLNEAYRKIGAELLLAVIVALSFYLSRIKRRPRLYAQVGMVFFLFLSLCNAFGIQYLTWLVPWVVGLGLLPTAVYYTATGVFMYLVYNWWCQGIPWYMADSIRIGDWNGHLDYFQLACWLSVLLMLAVAWMQIRSAATEESRFSLSPRSTRILQLATAFSLLVLLLFPAALQASRDSIDIPWATRQHDALVVRSAQFAGLSYQMYSMGRYQDAITAAQQGVQLNPLSADAFTNLAASYGALGMWDQAVQSGEQAFRIRPDSPLARNNLNWLLRQQQQGGGAQGPASATSRTAADFLNLSVQYYQARQFQQCIDAANQALKLNPNLPEGYNNLAACDSSLGMWDDAIRATQEALRLNPDFQLAKNNLAWALQQKQIQKTQTHK
jgi:tetratricopeptide (TPR) repeat protein